MTTIPKESSSAHCADSIPCKPKLRIGHFYPVTTSIFNGCPAAEVLCLGCPWKCIECSQPSLISPNMVESHDWQDVLYYLMSRRGLIDNVVFSGAEPLSQPHLFEAIVQCKSMGFFVGLHTCGIYPLRLETLLPLIDWLSFEILGLPEDYTEITSLPGSGETVWRSLKLALRKGVPIVCELYTPLHSTARQNIVRTAEHLAELGVERVVIRLSEDEEETLIDHDQTLQKIAPYFSQLTVRAGHRASV